jgi:hypothetical protein
MFYPLYTAAINDHVTCLGEFLPFHSANGRVSIVRHEVAKGVASVSIYRYLPECGRSSSPPSPAPAGTGPRHEVMQRKHRDK